MCRRLYWSVAVGIALLLIWEGWRLYPLPESDSLWFLPAAVNYAEGFHLLVNNLHPQANLYDSSHAYRFAFYPPGLPWLLGALAPEASPRGVYVLLAALNAAIILLTARFLEIPLRRQTILSASSAYRLGIAGLLCVATYASSFCLGRPDYLATLLVLAGWVAIERAGARRGAVWFWAGLTLGAMAFVQPVAGFIASALYGIWCGIRYDWKRSVMNLFAAFAFAVALLTFLLAINPNGIRCVIDGIRTHSIATLVYGTDSTFCRYFFTHSYAFGYGPLFVGGAVPVVWALWTRRRGLGSPLVTAFSGAMTLFLLYRFIGIAWDRFYNLWLFVPLLVLAAFTLGFERLGQLGEVQARRWTAAALALLLLGSLGFLHRTALFGFSLTEEATYVEARYQVLSLLAGHPVARIGVSKSLWVLFDDYNPVDSFGLDPNDLLKPAQYLFIQQRYTLYQEPPAIPGYRLVYGNFERRQPRFCGILLSPTMPSYRFAFYDRITPGAPVDPPAATQ